jgi:DNA-directed RNA polymerase subunit beta'
MNRSRRAVVSTRSAASGSATGWFTALTCWSRTVSVESGTALAEWDPFAMPIVTEGDGVIQFRDVIEGVSMTESLDEVTGLSRKVIKESPRPGYSSGARHLRPGDGGAAPAREPRRVARYHLPGGEHLPSTRATQSARVTSWRRFRAKRRRPRTSPAGCPVSRSSSRRASRRSTPSSAEIDGPWSASARTPRASGRSSSPPRLASRSEYLIAKGKHLTVREGDYVRAGEALMDGAANPTTS